MVHKVELLERAQLVAGSVALGAMFIAWFATSILLGA